MRTLLNLTIICCPIMACIGSIPQRHEGLFAAYQLVQEPSEAQKNDQVRQLVRDLRARFGSNAILGVRSGGPHGRRFSELVRQFGERGAIVYRESGANFEVRFQVANVPGAMRGPQIRTYEVTTSLVRLRGINEGAEVVLTSTKRGTCDDGGSLSRKCELVQDRLASVALYSMRFTGATQ